jgi:hypothetical protein
MGRSIVIRMCNRRQNKAVKMAEAIARDLQMPNRKALFLSAMARADYYKTMREIRSRKRYEARAYLG